MGIRVLVADDDAAMRLLIARVLQTVGAEEIVEAAHGSAAIARFEQSEFDLVILDWYMPEVSGLDVLHFIRADDADVPVLMVTAESQKRQVVEAIRAGATDYIVKPIEPDSLKSRLRQLLGLVPAPVDGGIYRARSVMQTDVITIEADATVGEAIDVLLEHEISGLPVVDERGELIGIITEYQLLKAIYQPEIKDQGVRELMTRIVLSVGEDTLLSEVAHLMEKHRIRRVPVVRDGRVVGVVARRDLLRYFVENEEALRQFLDTVRSAAPV